MIFRTAFAGLLIVFAVPFAQAEGVTETRGWSNCQGGDGVWAEMRISGCTEVIKSGKAEGANLARAHYNRGNALLQKAEYLKAIDDYSAALKLQPEDAKALHERCWARAVMAVELEDALADCNESLRLQPNDAETLGGRGFVYLRLKLYRTAIIDYDAALKLEPQNALILFSRGTAKSRAGDDEGGKVDRAAARALDAKIEEIFQRFEAAPGGGGMWAAMVDYWRAAMQWIY